MNTDYLAISTQSADFGCKYGRQQALKIKKQKNCATN